MIRFACFLTSVAWACFCVNVLGVTALSSALAALGGGVVGVMGGFARSFRRRRA